MIMSGFAYTCITYVWHTVSDLFPGISKYYWIELMSESLSLSSLLCHFWVYFHFCPLVHSFIQKCSLSATSGPDSWNEELRVTHEIMAGVIIYDYEGGSTFTYRKFWIGLQKYRNLASHNAVGTEVFTDSAFEICTVLFLVMLVTESYNLILKVSSSS